MADVSHFNIKVSVDSKTGEVQLQKLGDTVEKSTTKASAGFSKMSLALGGVLLGVGALATSAIKGAAEIETLTTQIGTMLGSVERGADIIEEVKQYGAETPFEMPQLANTTKQLLAYEIEQENVLGVLRQLGDVAAGSGADLQSLAINYGRIVQGGVATLEDLNQIADKGIPIMSMLSKQYGIGTAELKKMASEGKISSDDIAKAFNDMTSAGGMFFEGALAQSKTFDGMISTLKDNIGALLADAATPFLGILKDLIASLSPLIQDMAKFLVPIFERLSGVISEIVPPFMKLVDSVFGALRPILGPIISSIEKMAPLFGRVAEAAAKLIDGLQPVVDIWAQMIDEQIDQLMDFLESMLQVFIDLTPVIILTAQASATFLSVGLKVFNSVVKPIKDAIMYIIENGAKAAAWVARIFGGGEEATKAKVKQSPPPSGKQGGDQTIDPVTGLPVSQLTIGMRSPDGTMQWDGSSWKPVKKPIGKGDKGKAAALPGTEQFMQEEIEALQAYQAGFEVDSEEFATLARLINEATAEMEMLKRIADATFGTGPDAQGISPWRKGATEIAEWSDSAQQSIEPIITLVDELVLAYDQMAVGLSYVFSQMQDIWGENFENAKLFSIAQAIINTSLAMTEALKAGPVLGPILATMIGVLGGAQIQKIANTKPGDTQAPQISGIAQAGSAPIGSGRQINRLALSGGDSGRNIALQGEFVVRGTDLVLALNNNTRVTEGAGI